MKTIIKLTCVGPDRLTLGRDELRSSINHEFYVVTQKNNYKVILDMWVEFVVGSCRELFSGSSGFPSSTRTNILNSNGNSGKESHLVECLLLKWLLLIPLH